MICTGVRSKLAQGVVLMSDVASSLEYLELWESFQTYKSVCLLRAYAPGSLSASISPTGSGQRILLPLSLELALKGRLRQLKEAGYTPSCDGRWGQLKGERLRLLQETGYVSSHKLHSDLYALMQDVSPSAAEGLNAAYRKLYKGRQDLVAFLLDVNDEVMHSRYGEIDWKQSSERGTTPWNQYGRQIRRYDRRFFRRYDAAIIAVYQQANFMGLGQLPKGTTLRKIVEILTAVFKASATWSQD